jgi:hypothetical protein
MWVEVAMDMLPLSKYYARQEATSASATQAAPAPAAANALGADAPGTADAAGAPLPPEVDALLSKAQPSEAVAARAEAVAASSGVALAAAMTQAQYDQWAKDMDKQIQIDASTYGSAASNVGANPLFRGDVTATVTVRTVMHLVTAKVGDASLDDKEVADIMRSLNDALNPAGFSFVLALTQRHYDATWAAIRNSGICDVESPQFIAMRSATHMTCPDGGACVLTATLLPASGNLDFVDPNYMAIGKTLNIWALPGLLEFDRGGG